MQGPLTRRGMAESKGRDVTHASLVQAGFGFRQKAFFRGITELNYFMDNTARGGYNKTGQSIRRCDRFLLVVLEVVMREVYELKRRGNVLHLFTQMRLNRLTSDRAGLLFRVIVLMAGGRSARNKFHYNLVCRQKHGSFVRRLNPLRRKLRGSMGIGPPTLGNMDRGSRRELRQIRGSDARRR